MKNFDKLVKEMKDILLEAMSLDEDINYFNFYEKYCEAADQLNLNDGEDDDGELDIFRTIYRLGNDFFELKADLRAKLQIAGMDEYQRADFYKNMFTF